MTSEVPSCCKSIILQIYDSKILGLSQFCKAPRISRLFLFICFTLHPPEYFPDGSWFSRYKDARHPATKAVWGRGDGVWFPTILKSTCYILFFQAPRYCQGWLVHEECHRTISKTHGTRGRGGWLVMEWETTDGLPEGYVGIFKMLKEAEESLSALWESPLRNNGRLEIRR